ncbi:ABC transporter ATP-binding protein [Deltaproteobacteria bacterium IMCC39524]|nr:ABC transporter ATP-binding protein [Deltaproteobacteria bacterium IMCC39524]
MAIEIKGLSKTFRGKKRQRVEALKDLSLLVAEGEVFGFLGPNGAGKSTTIKTLVGQINPTCGYARIFNQPVSSPKTRLKVGYLPENPAFYDYLTAREYLGLVGRSFSMSAAKIARESERVLELLDLADSANRPVRGYSKGMVQRLGLAQTLLHNPELYILDEPMSGLDPVGRALVKQIMLDLKRRGKTVFFSTHVIADVEAVCDRVGIVAKGELRTETAVSTIISKGVDGYLVRLEQDTPVSLQEYSLEHIPADSPELFVPCKKLSVFMRQVDEAGCAVQMIEPHRKSLEDFFLKIIK